MPLACLPPPAVTSFGELCGYQTTQGAQQVLSPLIGGAVAPGAPRTLRDPNSDGDMR